MLLGFIQCKHLCCFSFNTLFNIEKLLKAIRNLFDAFFSENYPLTAECRVMCREREGTVKKNLTVCFIFRYLHHECLTRTERLRAWVSTYPFWGCYTRWDRPWLWCSMSWHNSHGNKSSIIMHRNNCKYGLLNMPVWKAFLYIFFYSRKWVAA